MKFRQSINVCLSFVEKLAIAWREAVGPRF
jgi:hypothetical protein